MWIETSPLISTYSSSGVIALLVWTIRPAYRRAPAISTLAYSDLIRYGLALASAGAGIIHLTAAPAHSHHELIFAFFIAVGVAQLVWAAGITFFAPSRRMLDLGAAINALVIGTWLASRIGGVPFIEGADHREPVEIKDAVSTLLEVMVVAGVFAMKSWKVSRPQLLRARVPMQALATLSLATIVLATPGIVLPAHRHADHVDGHIDGKHLAAAHSHGAERAAHGHAPGTSASAGHGHGDTARVAGHTEHAPGAVETQPVAGQAPVEDVKGIVAKVRYGPYFLSPASLGGDDDGQNRIETNVGKPCTDCYITSMKPDLTYEDGSNANLDTGPMLHHAVWTRPSIQDTTCGRNSAIGTQGMRFFASGNERTALEIPAGFGYHVGADPWNMVVEIMNHTEQPKTVYIDLKVTYRPGTDDVRDVTPVWMDNNNCGDSQYSIPAGKSTQLRTWTSDLTGRVVSTGGHVHDSGIKTVLTNENDDQKMCTSVAGYGRKPEYMGSIESMTTCEWDRLGTVRTGQDLGIHIYYDSPEPRSDVMGIMVAYVYETDDLTGGTPYNDDPPPDPEPGDGGGHDH